MGLRLNIPLPGPFSYTVGTPKVGRTLKKVAKTVAADKRRREQQGRSSRSR